MRRYHIKFGIQSVIFASGKFHMMCEIFRTPKFKWNFRISIWILSIKKLNLNYTKKGEQFSVILRLPLGITKREHYYIALSTNSLTSEYGVFLKKMKLFLCIFLYEILFKEKFYLAIKLYSLHMIVIIYIIYAKIHTEIYL